MTYQEVLDWLSDNGFFDDFDEMTVEEIYESIENHWDGRSEFSRIMSLDEFNDEYETYNNLVSID